MGCVQGQHARLWVPDSSVLVDETLVCDDATDDGVCIAGVPVDGLREYVLCRPTNLITYLSGGWRGRGNSTYIPATQTPIPLRYKRQNFRTHCPLDHVAKAETGSAWSVAVSSTSSAEPGFICFSSSVMIDD